MRSRGRPREPARGGRTYARPNHHRRRPGGRGRDLPPVLPRAEPRSLEPPHGGGAVARARGGGGRLHLRLHPLHRADPRRGAFRGGGRRLAAPGRDPVPFLRGRAPRAGDRADRRRLDDGRRRRADAGVQLLHGTDQPGPPAASAGADVRALRPAPARGCRHHRGGPPPLSPMHRDPF